MSIGLFLWCVVTLFLLWFWGWTTYILVQQKRGWKAFAAKNQLRYRPNNLLDSPEVSGSLAGYPVTIFATDHGSEDTRTRRVMTSIEVSLKSTLPSPCAIASGGMVKLVEELGLTQEYRPDMAGWDISYIARAREDEILQAYLTPSRVEALGRLMKRKRSWVILVFTDDIGLLRLDTSDPLESSAKISKLVNEIADVAKVLELDVGEDKVIASKRRKDDGKQKVIRVDENVLNENFGLTLEDE